MFDEWRKKIDRWRRRIGAEAETELHDLEERERIAEIGPARLEEQDLVAHGVAYVHHLRQIFIGHLYGIQRVLGQIAAFGDGHSHRLTHVPDLVPGKERLEVTFETGNLIHPHGHRNG